MNSTSRRASRARRVEATESQASRRGGRGDRAGFTLVEVVVAVMILSVGVLSVAGTSALVSRMVARGRSSELAADFAMQRMERLRVTGCTSQAAGTDTLYRGAAGKWVAANVWQFTAAPRYNWRVRVIGSYKTSTNGVAKDTLEMTIPCII